jgi:hypothetical protein
MSKISLELALELLYGSFASFTRTLKKTALHRTVPADDNAISRLHAVEARAALSDAPDE